MLFVDAVFHVFNGVFDVTNRPYHGFRRHLDGWAKRSEITVFVWEPDNK